MRSSAASVAGLVLAFLLAVPAVGHTTLDFASPGPGMRVSGELDGIQLGFADPVFEPVVTLTAPDGSAVAGTVEVIDERTITFVTDGIQVEGEYIVRYRVAAPDDDNQPELEGAYAFTYLGGGPSSGSNWFYYAGVALLLMSIGGYAAWRVSRIPPQDQKGRSG